MLAHPTGGYEATPVSDFTRYEKLDDLSRGYRGRHLVNICCALDR